MINDNRQWYKHINAKNPRNSKVTNLRIPFDEEKNDLEKFFLWAASCTADGPTIEK